MANCSRVESHSGKKPQSYPRIRQPQPQSVPLWEKNFCFKVGSVTWRRLLETHKYMYQSEKVIQWNDLAGKKAFDDAKRQFWAQLNGLPGKSSKPNSDKHIDEDIDWNPEIDPELLSGLEEARAEIKEDKEEKVIDSRCITLDQIIPTGWDVIYEEPRLLTGMIVGDDDTNAQNDDELTPVKDLKDGRSLD